MVTWPRSPTASRTRVWALISMDWSSSCVPEVRRSVTTIEVPTTAPPTSRARRRRSAWWRARPASRGGAMEGGASLRHELSCSPAVAGRPRRTGSAAPGCEPPGCARCVRAARRCRHRSRPGARAAAAAAPGQCDHGHLLGAGRLDGRQHVGRVAAGADGDQQVAGEPSARTWEKIELVVVVADRGEDGAVGGQRDGGKAGRSRSKRPTNSAAEMLRVTGRARHCRRPSPCRRP